jgi:LacI family repressor for deo operon, udp, cdd, tsx, nupC, and nupG
MKKPTISDVAKKAGVSKAAVSFYINNHTFQLSETTQKKIETTIKKLKYIPSASARNLAKGHTSLIGIVTVNLLADPFTNAIRGIQQEAFNCDKSLLISDAAGITAREKKDATLLLSRGSEGLIFISSSSETSNAFLNEIQAPKVFINRPSVQPVFPCITLENRKPIRDIVLGLARYGHTRIAYFTVPPKTWAFKERLEGYCEGISMIQGKPNIKTLFSRAVYTKKSLAHLEKTLLETIENEQCTAIVTHNDPLAHEIWKILMKHSIAIPEKVSLTGFDDYRENSVLIPSLTTVRQSFFEAGVKAVSMLNNLIQGNKISSHLHLQSKVIWRDSTSDCKGKK